MSDTILGGDFTVYYLNENRQKRLEYTGAGTVYTANQVYSALQDHFDELNQMDDGTPMSAQTPTEYTIGKIDPGDNEPWFIDHTTAEFISTGAIQTAGWDRVEGTNVGLVRMDIDWTSTAPQQSDIGKTVVMTTDGDTGTIVDFVDLGGTLGYFWIRPSDDLITNSFNDAPTAGGALTITGGTATDALQVSGSPALTGEMLWANIYNTGLATLEPETHQYIDQESALLVAYKDTSDWWLDGQFDILVQVKQPGVIGTGSSLIDHGRIKVLARQYSATYAWFEVDLSAGGRNPIPLSAGDDLDNTTGFRTLTGSSGVSDFDVENWIFVGATWATATKRAKLTQVTGTVADPILEYYLLGDPISDFIVSDAIKEYTGVATGDGTCTAAAPTDAGPANLGTPPIITFGYDNSADIDEDGTPEDYGLVVDVNQNTLADTWEWMKYVTYRGYTADIDAGAGTVPGRFYRGFQRRVVYGTQSGTWTEGSAIYFHDVSSVLQAYGTIGSDEDNGASGELMIYNWTLANGGDITTVTKCSDAEIYSGTNSALVTGASDVFSITPIQKCPLGDFAGGTFFGADGVLLIDYQIAEENSFQLKTNQGVVKVVPTKVNATIGNTRVGDKLSVFVIDANGDIIKDDYTIDSGQGAVNSEIIKVDPAIDTDEPGKTAGGIVRVVDVSGEIEDRYRFATWGTDEFALAITGGTDTGTGSATALVDTGGGFTAGARVGDIVYNVTEDTYAYVSIVTDDQNLVMTNKGSDKPVTSWAADVYKINGTVRAYTTSDTAYVPLIDIYETTGTTGSPGTETASLTYVAPLLVRARARNAGDILPYEADGTLNATGFSVNVIRTPDSIHN
ncbi:MAG: hypothetical protein ACTSYX_02900 [Candidatus Thorarchaeota archaeon]